MEIRGSDSPTGWLRVAEALSICAQGGQAKVTRAQMETARTGPAAEGAGAASAQQVFEQAADAVEEAALGQGVFLGRLEDFGLAEAGRDGAGGGPGGPPGRAR